MIDSFGRSGEGGKFLMTVSAFTVNWRVGSEDHELRLTGRALPHRPYTLAGKQRCDLTWYPGSPEATIQVLGPEEEPTTIKGRWSDRLLSVVEDTGLVTDQTIAFATLDNAPIAEAYLLAEAVDDIRKRGQLVEVAWNTAIRTGIISRFMQTWSTSKDVEWEIEFTWIKQGIPTGIVMVDVEETDLSTITQSVMARAEAARKQSKNSPFPQARAFADAVSSGVDAVTDASRSMQNSVVAVLDEVSAAMSAVRQCAGLLEYISDTYQRMNDVAYSTVDQTKQTRKAVADMTVGDVCGVSKWVRQLTRSNRKAAHEAARSRLRLLRMVNQDVMQVHYARDGQDVRDVSRMYYGSSDEWKRIAQFNHLASSKLRSGQVLLVPREQKGA